MTSRHLRPRRQGANRRGRRGGAGAGRDARRTRRGHRRADHLDDPKSGTIKCVRDRQHHGRRHARRPQALMPIAQGGVEYFQAPRHVRS